MSITLIPGTITLNSIGGTISSGPGSLTRLFYAYALNAEGESFLVSNQVLSSAGNSFDVAPEAQNSTSDNFLVFG